MEGTYICKIKTPVGEMKAKLSFAMEGNSLCGTIRGMGVHADFYDGMADGNTFMFSGAIRSIFGNARYEACGFTEGECIKITAQTNYGVYEIYGKRQK